MTKVRATQFIGRGGEWGFQCQAPPHPRDRSPSGCFSSAELGRWEAHCGNVWSSTKQKLNLFLSTMEVLLDTCKDFSYRSNFSGILGLCSFYCSCNFRSFKNKRITKMLENRYHRSVNQANAKSCKTDMNRKEE